MDAMSFILSAYAHGKPIGALGSNGAALLQSLGLAANSSLGMFSGDAESVTRDVLNALSGPVRFPQRFPVDDASICQ